MQKSTWLFYGIGLIVGACLGFVVHDLVIGMGAGAALGIIFARKYRRRLR